MSETGSKSNEEIKKEVLKQEEASQIITLHTFNDITSYNTITTADNDQGFGTRIMNYGDWILIAFSYDNITPLHLEEGKTMESCMGHFPHSLFVGRPFGTKIYSKNDTGFVYVLPFTPKNWTSTLARRTQIIFIPDISIILARSNVLPGQIVLEAGTGSASLTHHLASAIYPSGHVHTFDIVEERTESAKKELAQNRLKDVVSCYTRDVCTLGYPDEIKNDSVDFVFLDMPEPNKAIPFAVCKMKLGATLCIFVPCVEQVHKAIQAAISTNSYGCIESVRGHAVSYDFELPHIPVPPNLPCARGVDKRTLEDPISAPMLKPTQYMRTHTSYLIFMKKVIYAKEPEEQTKE